MAGLTGIWTAALLTAASLVVTAGGGAPASAETGPVMEAQILQPGGQQTGQPEAGEETASYDVNAFVLPEDAAVLVTAEGIGNAQCRVRAYTRSASGWTKQLETEGHLGKNGMSGSRHEGDKTTPIGLFQMNTPFGQCAALDGFPSNYIQVDASYVWEEESNRLVQGSSKKGERVGGSGYAGYYDYAVDMGYNRGAAEGRGSALFLHCEGADTSGTSGCIAIPREAMIQIMRLYGAWGDGRCYMALAPAGGFGLIYDSYGANGGLSPVS